MADFRSQQDHIRRTLSTAELAARAASDALLDGLTTVNAQIMALVAVIRQYARECPDPFQSLDIARLLQALLADMDPGSYTIGSITEWAHAELRIQALASRVARSLRDEGAMAAEQALVDLAVLHLRSLEESPQYARILTEMNRILTSGLRSLPQSAVSEFLGMARATIQLPTQPPS